MATRLRKPEPWRIKLYHSLIRQVRGKPLLEALHRLQAGRCAYDEEPCALLLPQATILAHQLGWPVVKNQQLRFATVDHVLPRTLGGENTFPNLVMAAQTSNAQKGAFAPYGRWVPHVRHSRASVERTIRYVESQRYSDAHRWAANTKFDRQTVTALLIEQSLESLAESSSIKFCELTSAA